MREVTQEDINLVVNAMEEFFKRAVELKCIYLVDLLQFMEPKFKQAGYRDSNGGMKSEIF